MTVLRAYHLSTAALVSAGAAALALGAESWLFFGLTLVVCLLYWYNEGSPRPRHLPDTLATLISLAAFLFMGLILYRTPEQGVGERLVFRLPLISHFLCVVQWVLLLKQSNNREITWVYFISLVHLAVGAILQPELPIAFLYLVYLLAAVPALITFHLKREIELVAFSNGVQRSRRRPAVLAFDPSEIRLDRIFLLRCMAGLLPLLILIGIAFSTLPRRKMESVRRVTRRAAQPITGFSERVDIGDLGRMLQSNGRVMQVRVTDEKGVAIEAPDLLLRGLTFDHYDGRRWHTSQIDESQQELSTGEPHMIMRNDMYPFTELAPRVQCDVTLEPIASRCLFAPFAMESITLPPDIAFTYDPTDDSIRTVHHRRGVIRYSTRSALRDRVPVPADLKPQRARIETRPYLQLPDGLSPRVRELAERVAGMREKQKPHPYQRAVRIRDFLADGKEFRFSLNARFRPDADMLDSFLFEVKEGHCEHFATAMAVLLRCVGVPTRLVNGFRGGEWNQFGKFLTYRQRDAHSWCEAYIEPMGWMTFDATPSRQAEPVRRAATFGDTLASARDYLEHAWIEFVVGFDQEKQRIVYALFAKVHYAVHWLLIEFWTLLAGEDFLSRGEMRDLPKQILMRIGSLFTGWVVFVLALVTLAALAIWVMRMPRGTLTKKRRAAMAFYRRFLRVLWRHGFRKPEHATPLEFAAQVISVGGPAFGAAGLVAWRFCEAYYGQRPLGKKELDEVNDALDDLEKAKTPPGQKRPLLARLGRKHLYLALAVLVGVGVYLVADWIIVTSKEEVRQVVNRMCRAAARADVTAFLADVDPNYSDGIADAKGLKEMVVSYFRTCGPTRVTVRSCQVSIESDMAVADVHIYSQASDTTRIGIEGVASRWRLTLVRYPHGSGWYVKTIAPVSIMEQGVQGWEVEEAYRRAAQAVGRREESHEGRESGPRHPISHPLGQARGKGGGEVPPAAPRKQFKPEEPRWLLDDFENNRNSWRVLEWGHPSETAIVTHENSRRLRVTVTRSDRDKAALERHVHLDLSSRTRITVDVTNLTDYAVPVALALSCQEKDGTFQWYETPVKYVKPGTTKTVAFDLTANDFKSEKTKWEHVGSVENLDAVRRMYLLIYSVRPGTFLFDNVAAESVPSSEPTESPQPSDPPGD